MGMRKDCAGFFAPAGALGITRTPSARGPGLGFRGGCASAATAHVSASEAIAARCKMPFANGLLGEIMQANDKAPEFTLPDEDGQDVSLKDLRGKNVVLFFYPRANTPG